MGARLYGRTVGNGSLSVVTAGFREALESFGLLEGVVSIDRSGGDEESDGPAGALARDGVFVGNLGHVMRMQIGAKHERHWVQVTPNSTHIPKKLLAAVVNLPNARILSASAWGSNVIRSNLADMGFDWNSDRVLTVCHGVTAAGIAPIPEEIADTRRDYSLGFFRVAHFSTSDGERKGTLELLKAWNILLQSNQFAENPQLLLVMDHHAREALLQRVYGDVIVPVHESVRFLPRGDMGSADMSRFLCRQHVLCAPSRGEGFGLVPLEARACGVPVVATTMTGHSAGHVRGPGVLPIVQASKLLPIDDGAGALAPGVDPEEIAAALMSAYKAWPGLSAMSEVQAPGVIASWSWRNQLAPLVNHLRG